MSTIHESVLVHWTGKELNGSEFVERLRSIYQDGLWCCRFRTTDVVRVVGDHVIELPRPEAVCFTELSRDNSDRHIEKYGPLGIGFRRDYLLRHGANPVFYVQSGVHGIANTNLQALDHIVRQALIRDDPATPFPAEVYVGALKATLSYVKPMSTEDTAAEGADLDFYDELEWRVVPLTMAVSDGTQQLHSTFVHNGRCKCFRFDTSEVDLIVVPNRHVFDLVLADPYLADRFRQHLPRIEVLRRRPRQSRSGQLLAAWITLSRTLARLWQRVGPK